MRNMILSLAAVAALASPAAAQPAVTTCTFHSVWSFDDKKIDKLPDMLYIALHKNGVVETAKEGVVSKDARFSDSLGGNKIASYTFWNAKDSKYVSVKLVYEPDGDALLSFDNSTHVYLVGVCS